MYASPSKKRQPSSAALKSTMISKKSVNSLQKSTSSKPLVVRTTISLTASKTKFLEHGLNSRIQSKCKFTIPSEPVLSRGLNKRLNTPNPLPSKLYDNVRRGSLAKEQSKKSILSTNSATKNMSYISGVTSNTVSSSFKKTAYQKVVQLNQNTFKDIQKEPLEFEPLLLPEAIDMSTQTNEGEILDPALIVGDLKIMQPSKFVIEEIERNRKDLETKKLLKATRTFEEHSKKDEQYLEDLQEFLDKNYVTRKPRRVRNISLEEDRKLIASMDELLQREKPKVESITDIRSRIKLKEQELLGLFNHFQKTTENFVKTNIGKI